MCIFGFPRRKQLSFFPFCLVFCVFVTFQTLSQWPTPEPTIHSCQVFDHLCLLGDTSSFRAAAVLQSGLGLSPTAPIVLLLGSPCTISLGTPCWHSCFLMPRFPPHWCSLSFWWSTSGTMVLSWAVSWDDSENFKVQIPRSQPQRISFNWPGVGSRGSYFLECHTIVLM